MNAKRGRSILRAIAGGAALGAAILLSQGCSSGCDAGIVDRAVAFIDAHRACETNADCIDIGTFCDELPGGATCGQKAMNLSGAASLEWRTLSQELRACAPSSCPTCDELVEPACTNGACTPS